MVNRRSAGIAAMTEPGWAAPERAGTLRTSMPPHAALHGRPIRQLDAEGELHGPDHAERKPDPHERRAARGWREGARLQAHRRRFERRLASGLPGQEEDPKHRPEPRYRGVRDLHAQVQ